MGSEKVRRGSHRSGGKTITYHHIQVAPSGPPVQQIVVQQAPMQQMVMVPMTGPGAPGQQIVMVPAGQQVPVQQVPMQYAPVITQPPPQYQQAWDTGARPTIV